LIVITKWLSLAAAGLFLLPGSSALAQNISAPSVQSSSSIQAYDINGEQTLVGTVLTYTASSQTAPHGPRLTLQTSSGVVDVHLGDVRTLSANHFAIQTGDTLRIIGENVSLANNTTQFLARILQKGTQAIAVRTTRGFPIPPSHPVDASNAKNQAGVM
jgi:hypothetical protein